MQIIAEHFFKPVLLWRQGLHNLEKNRILKCHARMLEFCIQSNTGSHFPDSYKNKLNVNKKATRYNRSRTKTEIILFAMECLLLEDLTEVEHAYTCRILFKHGFKRVRVSVCIRNQLQIWHFHNHFVLLKQGHFHWGQSAPSWVKQWHIWLVQSQLNSTLED